MVVIVPGPVSKRSFFCSLGLTGAALMYACATADSPNDIQFFGGAICLWAFLTGLSLFLLYAPNMTDRVFGKAACPNCHSRVWALRDVLRIGGPSVVCCRHCGYRARIRYWWLLGIPFSLILWLSVGESLDSILAGYLALAVFWLICLYTIVWAPSLK